MSAATPPQVMFVGTEMILLLFAAYALYEWGLALLGKIGTGWSESKANLAFGIPATVVAFLPCIVLAIVLRLQPLGGHQILKSDDVTVVYAMFSALGAGMVVELTAMIWFALRLRRIRQQSGKTPSVQNTGT